MRVCEFPLSLSGARLFCKMRGEQAVADLDTSGSRLSRHCRHDDQEYHPNKNCDH